MTTMRTLKLGAIIGLTILGLYVGRIVLLSHYRQKADLALFLSGDYKTAIKYYDKLIYWRPNAAGYFFNRGDAFQGDRQYENAIADYKKALELGINDSLQTILRIALSAKRQGDLQTAEQKFLQLLKLSTEKVEKENEFWAANYHLGQLEFKKKNYRKAIDYYNAAHIVSPSNFELYHRANAYFALGLVDSARQDFNTSIRFVKRDFIKEFPKSLIAQCDTCGFPFGSKEYELLTESKTETIIATLDKFADDKQAKELNDKLKGTEQNGR